MAMSVNACVIDTHPLVWWLLDPGKLSRRAMSLLADPAVSVHVPALAVLEFQYLVEIGRVEADTRNVLAYISESERFRLMPCDAAVLAAAVDLDGTRDPFDRTIAASALAYGMPLITRDQWMHERLANLAKW